jgi:LuxR family transcriptional regulator
MPQSKTGVLIEAYLTTRGQTALWQLLHADLEHFGFERVLYGRAWRRTAGGDYSARDAIVLSSYGKDFDTYFVEGGAFQQDVTTQWALCSEGAVSWNLTARLAAKGQLTPHQMRVHHRTREMGIVSGYTVSVRNGARALVGGFGLCAEPGLRQGKVDRVWDQDGTDIRLRLAAFDVCILDQAEIPPDQELTDRQRDVLEWAGEGKSIGEIASILQLHPGTVAKHMQSARDRLGVATTVQAVLRAGMQGQIYR